MDFGPDDFEDEGFSLSLRSVAIGVLPLLLLTGVLLVRSDILVPEPVEEVAPEFYPPVAVTFVTTLSEEREATYSAFVDSERKAVLRARAPSQVLTVGAAAGERVKAGQSLCRIKPTAGGASSLMTSPISGVVSSVQGKRGVLLAPGEACMTVSDMTTMIAHGAMPERHAQILRPGDAARLSLAGTDYASNLRIVYPPERPGFGQEQAFEVPLPDNASVPAGTEAKVTLSTSQVFPAHVPFGALDLVPGKGMVVRIVTGTGPTGTLRTLPVTLVAATRTGFYVEGLPREARLVIRDPEFPTPEDGEIVRIGRVS